jgi:molybdopterin converting factor small subunit
MITVRLQYFSQLRDLQGPEKLRLAPGATVTRLLEELYASVRGLKEWDKCLLVAVGTAYVAREHVLAPDDVVSLMPPVQGG